MILKFELTNQDSASGKNFNVLTPIYVNRISIEVGQILSLQTALNIHEKGHITEKHEIFVSQSFNLARKLSHSCPATRSSLNECL